jgi:hypothetical protein
VLRLTCWSGFPSPIRCAFCDVTPKGGTVPDFSGTKGGSDGFGPRFSRCLACHVPTVIRLVGDDSPSLDQALSFVRIGVMVGRYHLIGKEDVATAVRHGTRERPYRMRAVGYRASAVAYAAGAVSYRTRPVSYGARAVSYGARAVRAGVLAVNDRAAWVGPAERYDKAITQKPQLRTGQTTGNRILSLP